MVAIAHNKYVIKSYRYFGPINYETCKLFIDEQLPDMFKNSAGPKEKLFHEDCDPSQNRTIACESMDSVGCRLFKVPPCSPYLNPIQNIFHLIAK